MMDYIWLYILSGLALVSLIIFLMSLSKDVFLLKKLKKKKQLLVWNFLLPLVSLSCLGVIVYLFFLLKEQIELMQL